MDIHQFIDYISTLDIIRIQFKQISKQSVLILWHEQAPIAHLYVKDKEFSIDYPEMFKLPLPYILQIQTWLYEFVETK